MLLALAAGGWWATHGEQAALFSDLNAQDAAVIAAELDKLKVPYTLQDRGATVLVDASQVHALRLQLMQKDLPLHGAVGFELFNNADIGMTEFAQKINYQRALQGELTRTILSFPEIRDARVHLALPEQSLFRQASLRPKAAVTLGMRAGQTLRTEQVRGIQRLVASAVPGLVAQEVTIVDQQGVPLSRASDSEDDAGGSEVRLQFKRETENYLSRKAGSVLEGVFGPGQSLASVDVTLDMDRVRVTTEDVLAAPDAKGGAATGVLVRERESARDSALPEPRPGDARAAQGSSMQRDTEYQAGRRVEQLVNQPGAIRRLQVVALVRQELTEAQRDEVKRLVGAAVGAVAERGDSVVVQPVAAVAAATAAPQNASASQKAAPPAERDLLGWVELGAHVALIGSVPALLLGVLAIGFERRRARPRPAIGARERQLALQQVHAWLLQAAPAQVAREMSAGPGASP
jgi:flagellar M-ring protein FliF